MAGNSAVIAPPAALAEEASRLIVNDGATPEARGVTIMGDEAIPFRLLKKVMAPAPTLRTAHLARRRAEGSQSERAGREQNMNLVACTATTIFRGPRLRRAGASEASSTRARRARAIAI